MNFSQTIISQFPIGLVGLIQERKQTKTIIDFLNLARSQSQREITSMTELKRLMEPVVQVINSTNADEIDLVMPRFRINGVPYERYVSLMMAVIQFSVPSRIQQTTKIMIHVASWNFDNDHECDDRLAAVLFERAKKIGYDVSIVSNDRFRSLSSHADNQVEFESFTVPLCDKMDLDTPTTNDLIVELERFAAISSKQLHIGQLQDCRSTERLRRVGFEFRGVSVVVDPMRD